MCKAQSRPATTIIGGGLSFGPDGKLYWSVGDNVCCSTIDPYPGGNAQSLTNMYGKVLRLNPDGTVPTDNPFYRRRLAPTTTPSMPTVSATRSG